MPAPRVQLARPPRTALRRDRKSAVAVMYAAMAVPILAIVGLAVDYGFWNQAEASLALAVNGAALNAVKVAGAAVLNGDSDPVGEGQIAGKQWFIAQSGAASDAAHLTINSAQVNVTITTGANTIATVTYTGAVPALFGNLFTLHSYPVTVTASAVAATNPFLEVVVMLDNSSSMDLGATPGDMLNLYTNSPCSPYNAYVPTNFAMTNWASPTLQAFAGTYSCNGYDGQNYGAPACPFAQQSGLNIQGTQPGYYPGNLPAGDTWPGKTSFLTSAYTCKGVLPQGQIKNGSQVANYYPLIGPPCSFACHWDNNKDHNGNYQDLYGMARSQGITLRFDLVKNAVNTVLTEMAKYNISSINNLSVGIYDFNTSVTRDYPNCNGKGGSCEAGHDFNAAMAAVGTPPTKGAQADNGIQPVVGGLTGNNDDTNFPEAMTTLANNYVTAAGDGSTAAQSRKVLFIVTDGMEDDANSQYRGPIESNYCNQFKNTVNSGGLGYQVYVVYTPYYPETHTYYAANLKSYVEGSGTNTLTYQLQACSSGNKYFISAADQTTLTKALVGFLKQAINSPNRFLN